MIPSYLSRPEPHRPELRQTRRGYPFLDRTLQRAAAVIRSADAQTNGPAAASFMRRLHPGSVVVALLVMLVAISLGNNLRAQGFATLSALLLLFCSQVPFREIYRKVLVLSSVFGLLIYLPATLNLVAPGKIILTLWNPGRPLHWWIYTIPAEVGITDQGVLGLAIFFLRVMNSILLALTFVYATSFVRLLKGLKILLVPDFFTMILGLAYRYIFILAKTIGEAYFALKSRLFGVIDDKSVRNIVSGRMFYIFSKSRYNYEQTYMAMVSRGYSGTVRLADTARFRITDLLFLLSCLAAAVIIIML